MRGVADVARCCTRDRARLTGGHARLHLRVRACTRAGPAGTCWCVVLNVCEQHVFLCGHGGSWGSGINKRLSWVMPAKPWRLNCAPSLHPNFLSWTETYPRTRSPPRGRGQPVRNQVRVLGNQRRCTLAARDGCGRRHAGDELSMSR